MTMAPTFINRIEHGNGRLRQVYMVAVINDNKFSRYLKFAVDPVRVYEFDRKISERLDILL